MTQKFYMVFAAICLIACATLSPIAARPLLVGPDKPGFGAFSILGFCIHLALRRTVKLSIVTIVGAAGLLEALQIFAPDRNPAVLDAMQKAAGGAFGVFAARMGTSVLSPTFESQLVANMIHSRHGKRPNSDCT
jgi:hypothetical protein